jgi:hypothetical protein
VWYVSISAIVVFSTVSHRAAISLSGCLSVAVACEYRESVERWVVTTPWYSGDGCATLFSASCVASCVLRAYTAGARQLIHPSHRRHPTHMVVVQIRDALQRLGRLLHRLCQFQAVCTVTKE